MASLLSQMMIELLKSHKSQSELSSKTGLSQGTISRYSRGAYTKFRTEDSQQLRKLVENKLKDYYSGKLRVAMEKKGFKLDKLSSKIKIPVQVMHMIEVGEILPDAKICSQLSIILQEQFEPPPAEVFFDKGIPFLREIREKSGISQTDLSMLTGVHQRSISAYESSDRKPNQEDVEKLASKLGVEPIELIIGLIIHEKPMPAHVILKDKRELEEIEAEINLVKAILRRMPISEIKTVRQFAEKLATK